MENSLSCDSIYFHAFLPLCSFTQSDVLTRTPHWESMGAIAKCWDSSFKIVPVLHNKRKSLHSEHPFEMELPIYLNFSCHYGGNRQMKYAEDVSPRGPHYHTIAN